MSRPRHRFFAVIGMVTLAAFALRALPLGAQSLWRDEVDALRFATGPLPELLSRFAQVGWNGPLYYLLLRGWVGLTGTSEYAPRFLSLLFGVLSIPLVYAVGRRLFTPQAGLLGALLVASSPYMVWYSQEVKMYTLVPALILLAIYALHRAIAGGRWTWWAAQVLATTFALYSHILAALAIPIQVLLYLVWWPRARKQWVGGLVSLACLTLPYIPLLVWQWPLVFQTRETGFYPYTPGEMTLILLTGWTTGILPLSSPLGRPFLGLMGGLAMLGLGVVSFLPSLLSPGAAEDEVLRNGLNLLAWLLLPLLMVGLISQWQPLFTDRYLTWSAPAFYLFVGLGLAFLLRFETWGSWVALLLVGVVLVINGMNTWRQVVTPIKSDFRAAAAYVSNYRPADEEVVPSTPRSSLRVQVYLPLVGADRVGLSSAGELIVFQIPYGRYTFDYYYPAQEYSWADGHYTNRRTADGSYSVTEQENARYMQEIIADKAVVWLVATETTMWDERGLVQAWLDEHARRVDEAHFTRVDVFRYALD